MNLIDQVDHLLGGTLAEARKEEFEYDEEFETKTAKQNNDQTRRSGTRVKLTNQAIGQLSTLSSKMAKDFIQIKALQKETDALFAKYDAGMLELADQVFDAEDANYTRIMETASFITKVSKATTRGGDKKFNLEKFVTLLEESGISEDILAQTKLILEASYDITKVVNVKSSVKTELKEGIVSWTYDKLKSALNKIFASFKKVDKQIKDKLTELNNKFEMETT